MVTITGKSRDRMDRLVLLFSTIFLFGGALYELVKGEDTRSLICSVGLIVIFHQRAWHRQNGLVRK